MDAFSVALCFFTVADITDIAISFRMNISNDGEPKHIITEVTLHFGFYLAYITSIKKANNSFEWVENPS